jgi:hypothetical protein
VKKFFGFAADYADARGFKPGPISATGTPRPQCQAGSGVPALPHTLAEITNAKSPNAKECSISNGRKESVLLPGIYLAFGRLEFLDFGPALRSSR